MFKNGEGEWLDSDLELSLRLKLIHTSTGLKPSI